MYGHHWKGMKWVNLFPPVVIAGTWVTMGGGEDLVVAQRKIHFTLDDKTHFCGICIVMCPLVLTRVISQSERKH